MNLVFYWIDTMTDYFVKFMQEKSECQRHVYADWGWIVPPISGSATPVYLLELENRIIEPNYFYLPNPWQEGKHASGKCPFAHS